jgi:HAD superfamily hydrolase (TIGR01509 family)
MIKLLITDFDGTLVDTFEANYYAYKRAFEACGLTLKESEYAACFGLRFDAFMNEMQVTSVEIKSKIKDLKALFYPDEFQRLKVNFVLLDFIRAFRRSGGRCAVGSTARKENLINALKYIGAHEDFDLILSGADVINGKPSPEIYESIIRLEHVLPEETLIFEDSEVGAQAAVNAGINYILINNDFYGN